MIQPGVSECRSMFGPDDLYNKGALKNNELMESVHQ